MDTQVKQPAQSRYYELSSDRQPFLDTARECAKLTLPYLLTDSGHADGSPLPVPWQSLGARGVNVLASKLMLALFPVNTSFFKLQINDAEIAKQPNITSQVRSGLDLGLAKMEKMINQQIAETSDRVVLHHSMKHLIVTGNSLCFIGKKAIRTYPLSRYVCRRDENGTAVEIVTEETVHRSLLPKEFNEQILKANYVNAPGEDGPKLMFDNADEATVYTWAVLKDGSWVWHQEVDGQILPDSRGRANQNVSPWIPLRFNAVDGEDYGRGRVEEFIGDLSSLEGLMKTMVEGTAGAAKLVFLVSPSATIKPKTLAEAANGACIQGRKDDVSVVEVGKTSDFRTVMEMIGVLSQRIADAFLILRVRDSERTTAEEVRATQQELNEQLGGIFGTLTTELLLPYLNRKLYILSKNPAIPQLPKKLVFPVVVAGLNGIGRGQDRQALMEFMGTIATALGPEAIPTYIDTTELIKRLAASAGIDTLGLVKSEETISRERAATLQQQQQQAIVNQAGQLAKSPIVDHVLNNGNNKQAAEGPTKGR